MAKKTPSQQQSSQTAPSLRNGLRTLEGAQGKGENTENIHTQYSRAHTDTRSQMHILLTQHSHTISFSHTCRHHRPTCNVHTQSHAHTPTNTAFSHTQASARTHTEARSWPLSHHCSQNNLFLESSREGVMQFPVPTVPLHYKVEVLTQLEEPSQVPSATRVAL